MLTLKQMVENGYYQECFFIAMMDRNRGHSPYVEIYKLITDVLVFGLSIDPDNTNLTNLATILNAQSIEWEQGKLDDLLSSK